MINLRKLEKIIPRLPDNVDEFIELVSFKFSVNPNPKKWFFTVILGDQKVQADTPHHTQATSSSPALTHPF